MHLFYFNGGKSARGWDDLDNELRVVVTSDPECFETSDW
jgi:hypothetical protein